MAGVVGGRLVAVHRLGHLDLFAIDGERHLEEGCFLGADPHGPLAIKRVGILVGADLVARAVDPEVADLGLGFGVEEIARGDDERRAVAFLDRADRVIHTEQLGRDGRDHRKSILSGESGFDRFVQVLEEVAALARFARGQRDGRARLAETPRVGRGLLPGHHRFELDVLGLAHARDIGLARVTQRDDQRVPVGDDGV